MEIERPFVVVAHSVAARVPRSGVEMAAELGKLVVPVGAIAADPVHTNDQFALARVIDGNPGCGRDEFSLPLRHRTGSFACGANRSPRTACDTRRLCGVRACPARAPAGALRSSRANLRTAGCETPGALTSA